MAYPACCVVRASLALPPGRSRFWATCGVTFKFLHSATKSVVSYALSPPTVTCFVPGICSSITSAASRSAVPLAWNTSVFTIRPLRFSTRRFPLYSAWLLCPCLCVPTSHPDLSSIRASRWSASPRGSLLSHCLDHPAEPWACHPFAENSSNWPTLPVASHPL